jgi:uncharacterized protein (DUF1800 family)
MSSTLAALARRRPKRPKGKKRHQDRHHKGRKHQGGKNKGRPKSKPKKKPKAKPKPAPATPPYAAVSVLPTDARHLANRFSYGVTPALAAEVWAAGGHLAWFDQQLDRVPAPSSEPWDGWWPDLHLEPAAVYQRQVDKVRNSSAVGQDMARRTMMRRIASTSQVLEVMTEFWENHLHVPAAADNIGVYRTSYGEVVRAGALGRFDDLLRAAILHPAMLFYLGNTSSTKKHPNENLGRELLELHTLGVGHHTEDDVKSSARILTGWRAKTYSTWEPYYSTADHWTGTVTVQDFTDANTDPDGRETTYRYLAYLAHHPATARRIATKLVRQFVSEDAPRTLVDQLADVYLAHDTEIRPVLRALVRSAEFAASVDQRLRDADEDVAATYRLLGAVPTAPVDGNSAANQTYSQVSALGLAPFAWPRPDGQPTDNKAWASPTRALASMSLHWNMAGRSWPKNQVAWTLPAAYLPVPSLSFRDLVDHVSRRVLHRPASAELLEMCCVATGCTPTTTIDAKAKVLGSDWTKLAAAVLDSPAFYQH